MSSVTIRKATWSDMPHIAAILNHYIATTTSLWYTEPHGEEWMASWRTNHLAPNRPALVAERDGKIIGFASLSAFRNIGYYPTAESSIYLIPEAQGLGLGKRLMAELIESGREGGLEMIVAWIDSENAASIAFHESLGFTHVGQLRDVGKKNGVKRSVDIFQLPIAD